MVPVRRRSAVGGCHRRPLTRGSPIIITPAKTTELPKRISYTFSSLRFGWIAGLVSCALFGVAGLGVQAQAQHASGGGTYFVESGIRSEFQFDQGHVQWKIGHPVLWAGPAFQRLLFSHSGEHVGSERHSYLRQRRLQTWRSFLEPVLSKTSRLK